MRKAVIVGARRTSTSPARSRATRPSIERRSRDDDEVRTSPVFVDASGRRGRLLTWTGLAIALACLAFVMLVLMSLTSDPIQPDVPARDGTGTSQLSNEVTAR